MRCSGPSTGFDGPPKWGWQRILAESEKSRLEAWRFCHLNRKRRHRNRSDAFAVTRGNRFLGRIVPWYRRRSRGQIVGLLSIQNYVFFRTHLVRTALWMPWLDTTRKEHLTILFFSLAPFAIFDILPSNQQHQTVIQIYNSEGAALIMQPAELKK